MGAKSRRKGCRGELEVAHLLDFMGFPSERGAQRSGSSDSPDVKSVLNFQIEVKRAEVINFFTAMEQAEKDSGGKKLPLVAARKNRTPWLFAIRAVDIIRFAEEVIAARRQCEWDSEDYDEYKKADAGVDD